MDNTWNALEKLGYNLISQLGHKADKISPIEYHFVSSISCPSLRPDLSVIYKPFSPVDLLSSARKILAILPTTSEHADCTILYYTAHPVLLDLPADDPATCNPTPSRNIALAKPCSFDTAYADNPKISSY